MSITEKSDAHILKITRPMIDDVVKASNNKDWASFSRYQTEEEAIDPENRRNVEKLWDEHPLLCSLSLGRDILGVLRQGDVAQIVWKQRSTAGPGDYLARYFVKEIDQQIKEVGFLID